MNLVPKIHHYHPHIAVITGIAWDHMNVFPTYENYVEQFSIFIKTIDANGKLFYYKHDADLEKIAAASPCEAIAYEAFDHLVKNNKTTY